MKNEKEKLAFIEAVINNDTQQVQKFLQEGMDANLCLDEAKITPLHFAAQNNAVEVIPILIAAGADICARTEEDQTALDIALLFKHDKIVQILSYYQDLDEIVQH